MSITRLTITDDSGAGTDGTIANAAWVTSFYDTLDARWSRATITSTGTQNNLSISQADLVMFNNASDLTVTGIAAPASPAKPGKPIRCVSTGAGKVFFAHQSGSSDAANRIVCFATSATTPLAGGGGTAMLVYDDANSRWRLIHHEQGAYLTPTFAAGDYTASAGTWTPDAGDVITMAYRLDGRRLHILFEINGTDVSTTPGTLNRVIPGGFTSDKQTRSVIEVVDAGATPTAGRCRVTAGGTSLIFEKLSGNWTATSSDNTDVRGQITLEVS